MGCAVFQVGVLRPIARDMKPENAIKLCDALWKPGNVFFVEHEDGTSVTVGSAPLRFGCSCDEERYCRVHEFIAGFQ